MATELTSKIRHLSDLDLAILVSLTSREHCIFYSEANDTTTLRDELRLACGETFGLETVVVDCSPRTTVDDFSEAILVDVVDTFEDATEQPIPASRNLQPMKDYNLSHGLSRARSGSPNNRLDDRRVADVIIATSLDLASSNVQVQALELLRTKRIFTRTAMHVAPKDYLLLVVASDRGARLSHHLNDMFALSHVHSDDDGYVHIYGDVETNGLPRFVPDELQHLRNLKDTARLAGEVRAYLHNIVVFLRNSRYVKGGVTAAATQQLRAVASALAPLHGLDYIPPSLVALAARKVYPHRIVLATEQTERSLQWGSDQEAVRRILDGLTVEDVIDDVIASLQTPL